jgi:ligand-binding SRPBCC domain-containing protein
MERRGGFEIASRLEAAPDEVWDRATTPEGINDELRPLMRMTVPAGFESLEPERVVLGEPIGRSWVLLGGLIPVDYDDITLVELEPGRRFVERGRLLSQRMWQHVRSVESVEGGCLIRDALAWEPRIPVSGRALRPMFATIFRHRHRRLRRHFGGEAVDQED